MLAHREISPSELLEETIGRVHQINPAINAIATIDEQRARADARESERRQLAGNRLSPVDGLIITVKDNIFVRNMRTTWGSRLYENFVPELDDIAVERLRAGGAIILGKTNTPEFALSAVTDNLVFGPTRNPWDLNCTPGGSSGGAAAAVAAGLSPLALATDAGGSIRRPCSYTGTVGLKPSIGQVPRCHSFPATAFDLQTIGPIGRTVDDVAMMFDVIAGPDQRDRSTSNFQSGQRGQNPSAANKPLRILYVPRIENQLVDLDIADSVASAADTLRELGHHVEEGDLPVRLSDIDEIWSTLTAAGCAHVVADHTAWEQRVGPAALALVERGMGISATRYLRALQTLNDVRRRFVDFMKTTDVILTPSSPALPWSINEAFPRFIGGQPATPRAAAAFATFVNVTGHPALALPSSPAQSGLPIGFQLIGRFGEDRLLLDLGKEYELARPWADRWPRLAL